MMNNSTNLGDYLRAGRQQKGLSLRAVEEAVGVSNAYLSQLEQGKIKQPSPNILHKLSQLYEVPYITVLRMIGYPTQADEDTPDSAFAARIGPLTQDEEDDLVDYLQFLRSKNKRGE